MRLPREIALFLPIMYSKILELVVFGAPGGNQNRLND